MTSHTRQSSPQAQPRVVVLSAPGAPDLPNADALGELVALDVVHADGLGEALHGASMLLLWDFFSAALRDAWWGADALEWVHVAAAGVDAILFDDLRDSDVVLTNAHGTFDQPIAEYVAAAVLAHDKRLHESAALQRAGTWRHRETRRTAGSQALVIGTGGIGRAIARLLRALGMQVRGGGRTAREDDPDFGTVVPTDSLAEHIGWADHVVLVAPLTQGTRGLIDAQVLAAMKPSAHLINVGRGALVDEDALIAALGSGRPSAATLDVFMTEPLPSDHPFWGMDNVAISAHMCGDVLGWRDELAAQFEDNLRRRLAGQPLRNVVDKNLGYVPRPN
ncbi:D-2-hydroxyacid dehydrogenase [Gephyromycinifex aptenodytis]|uniref:D-2-hydroxyacid dehydrogenase n=1 Tax=Gephyromycinifex aptenodytis TaxID=2716227 RepID=UPI001B2FF86F|nr:D-2-hydroxyacid dehydrogenase [Gephyromycinifex aptenodytis]